MPGAEHGFAAAVSSSILGFAIGVLVNSLPESLPGVAVIKDAFNILSIVGLVELVERANYWGITYTLGYLFGLALVGRIFSSWWEVLLSTIFLFAYLTLKITNKIFS